MLYLPPIHPIGETARKGRNDAPRAAPGDPGSPWAIGGRDGGHTAIHRDLGTIETFDRLVAAAREHEIEIALDFAVQCSADHPWLTEHPEWFRRRPDGTLKYAENPPKRYRDIYNVDFECEDWRGLWRALRDVVLHWLGHGVRVFRVDNPHTKPLAFWEWLIESVRAVDPAVVFLSEAFTREAMMRALAKAGFSQSYTYFTWKNTRWELERVRDASRRPGARATSFAPTSSSTRLTSSATTCSTRVRPGSPRGWSWRRPCPRATASTPASRTVRRCRATPARRSIWTPRSTRSRSVRSTGRCSRCSRRLNEIRRAHPALQRLDNVTFLETENDALLGYAQARAARTCCSSSSRWTRAARRRAC